MEAHGQTNATQSVPNADDVTLNKETKVKFEETEEKIKLESTDPSITQDDSKIECKANKDDDDDLEEGELKDDDDDDDDEPSGLKKELKDSSDDSDSNSHKRSKRSSTRSSNSSSSNSGSSSSSSSSSSGAKGSKKSSISGHSSKSKKIGYIEAIKDISKRRGSSIKSSSSEENKNGSYQRSYSSRHGSSSRQSPHSYLSYNSRRRSSPISSQQARLVSMRAKLLEARFREIEMRSLKGKPSLTSPSTISSISSGPVRNLKTTLTKPQITYAENPNPFAVVDPTTQLQPKSPKKKPKKHKKHESKSSSSKRSKKRKKKSSSATKKRKISKNSNASKKSTSTNDSKAVVLDSRIQFENVVDHQGPRTPPDNLVSTLDDQQIEWPSYLIKMTITQPSISYSVNPDSVLGKSFSDRTDTADLNSDFSWYCNYFVSAFEMDKAQAQHQAQLTMIATGEYDDDALTKWLEKRGLSKQSNLNDDKDIFPFLVKDENCKEETTNSGLLLRQRKPKCTILKSQREIVLPNGKILPPGTIQKIVHPYPKFERDVPEVLNTFYDLY